VPPRASLQTGARDLLRIGFELRTIRYRREHELISLCAEHSGDAITVEPAEGNAPQVDGPLSCIACKVEAILIPQYQMITLHRHPRQ